MGCFSARGVEESQTECFLVCLYPRDLKFPDSVMTLKKKGAEITVAVTRQFHDAGKLFNSPELRLRGEEG